MDSTANESDYSLFSISQAAHACNLSRSSLIRLEERGLLTPARTNAKSRYRYYDNNNITRILQIQKFQWMGFLRLWSRGCPCCSKLQRCVCVPMMCRICPCPS